MDGSDQLHGLLASIDKNVAWKSKLDELGGEVNVSC